MGRYGILATALIALMLALPLGLVAAQDGGTASSPNIPPAFIFGTATIDGIPVPEGTMVVAMAGETRLDSTMAMVGGKFQLELPQPPAGDNMVSFTVGDRTCSWQYEWMSGGREMIELNADLRAMIEEIPPGPAGVEGPSGIPGPTGADGTDGAAGPAGPAGPMGSVGPEGPAGADGGQGAQGVAGPAGPPGSNGAVGPAGPSSPMGVVALIVAIVAAIIAVAAIIMTRPLTRTM
ncbi:MAG: hypothetical protein F4W95_07205 [Chloroflexi bacterium]|nr:hypothetical protein [Chloroflexota bacterium]MYD48258.1 hypothetical protein [Chloroflexota bacterium]